MAEIVKVEGLKELQERLKALPDRVSKDVLREVLLTAARPLVGAMRAGAPKHSGDLADSITAGSRLSSRQASLHRQTDKNDVEIFVGPGPLSYAHIVEFGSKYQQSKPYVRPAWDSGKGALLESIKSSLTDILIRHGG
jgi:HK97 gp10 family phage protein